MNSIYAPLYRDGSYIPVVHAYYDRADMLHTTEEGRMHAHTLCEIMYVNEGEIVVDVEGDTLPVGRGEYIFIDAYVHHLLRLEGGSACAVMNIEFQLEHLPPRCPTIASMVRADESFRRMLDAPTPCLVLADRDGTVYNLLKQIIQLADSTHPEAEALCSMLTTQVLSHIARARAMAGAVGPARGGSAHLTAALSYIHAHFREPITVREVAGAAHTQPAYLHRLFRERMRQTVGAYIGQLRVQHAQALLRDTRLPLADIAAAAGIGSQQRLSQLFRRQLGVTPSEYRSQTHHQSPTGGEANA